MWRQFYHLLTAHEGMYIFYLIPILYGVSVVFHVIATKRLLPGRLEFKDIISVIILLALMVDFMNYLYLFFTRTGELLPSNALIVKYTVGFFLWLWLVWYGYNNYFTRRAAGERFRKRRITLVWGGVGSFVLALVGGILS